MPLDSGGGTAGILDQVHGLYSGPPPAARWGASRRASARCRRASAGRPALRRARPSWYCACACSGARRTASRKLAMAPARSLRRELLQSRADREGRRLVVGLELAQPLGLGEGRRRARGVSSLAQHLADAEVRLRRARLQADGFSQLAERLVRSCPAAAGRCRACSALRRSRPCSRWRRERPPPPLRAGPSATARRRACRAPPGSAERVSSAMARRSAASAPAKSSRCLRATPRL